MERVKELYEWGDISKREYMKRKGLIQQEIKGFVRDEYANEDLVRLTEFLGNVAKGWQEANPEQRNKLARCLFQEVWVKEKQVVAVKPQPKLAPFFKLNYEEFVNSLLKKRPRGVSANRAISQG